MERVEGDPATTEAETSDDDRSEFERFEDLARRLVRVPKSEVDAERAKRNGS